MAVARHVAARCAFASLAIGVQAIQLSPYQAGVAGHQPTCLRLSRLYQHATCPLALSGAGRLVRLTVCCPELRPLAVAISRCVTRRTILMQGSVTGTLSTAQPTPW